MWAQTRMHAEEVVKKKKKRWNSDCNLEEEPKGLLINRMCGTGERGAGWFLRFCPEQQEEWSCCLLRSGRPRESRSRSGPQELSFVHITFETSLSHPSGSDKWPSGFMTVLFAGDEWAKELNLGVINMEMVFKDRRLNEITQGSEYT